MAFAKRKGLGEMSAVRGHPFQLYYHLKQEHPESRPVPEFFLSPSISAAQKEHVGAIPVRVTILTKLYGHSYTHKLLRKHGSMWVCREGGIYYKTKEGS